MEEAEAIRNIVYAFKYNMLISIATPYALMSTSYNRSMVSILKGFPLYSVTKG